MASAAKSAHARLSQLAAALLLAPCCVLAVPAHVQAHTLDQQQVMAGAAQLYGERMAALRTMQRLDHEPDFHQRVQRIARRLIAQAANDFPATAGWAWEVHTTSDDEEAAYAMAGGKLLVSSAFVQEYTLSDAELAMVLAHEIMHAVLLHNLAEFEEVLKRDPSWAQRPFAQLEYAVDHDGALMTALAPLGVEQELEADRQGLLLAWRAGWPAPALAGYYRKLVRNSHAPNQERFAHPAPTQRWQAVRALAAELGKPAE